jgi:hypothetical protein
MDPITLPSPEERKAILAAHAHRYPERFDFTVVGDGGKSLKLPILLGNPSGSCKMPSGQEPTDAWATTVAATFKAAKSDDVGLVADCVLWPDASTWEKWINRWPGLPVPVGRALRRKAGASLAQIETPDSNEKPPEEIAQLQRRAPSTAWRRFVPDLQTAIDLAISCPDLATWQGFQDALKEPGADYVERTRHMAQVAVEYSSMPVADLFARWPGLPVTIVGVVGDLAGIAAEFERGEF